MKIVVTGVGIVSALGIGAECNITSIREAKSGIVPSPTILKTDNLLPVGELQLTNGQLHASASISESKNLSRTALLGILAVREALHDAQIDYSKRVGLVSATSVGGMDLTEHFYAAFLENNKSGRLRDVRMHDCAASTYAIKEYCHINGYTTTLSTACSSAANAIAVGARLLQHGVVDYVVAGGCDALSAFTLNGFKSLMILSDIQCRPFDKNRTGLNLGEGAGYLVLQRENEATSYYAHLSGYANRNDAFHQTASTKTGDGAYLAMSDAMKMANISPEKVGYINAHGTGTINNDASECAAFARLFGSKMPPFSSTKGFMGHTLAAAGGIEAVLSVLAVKHGFLYPNLNFESPIEEFRLMPVSRFEQKGDVNCVLTNSFGFGGNCCSLIFTR